MALGPQRFVAAVAKGSNQNPHARNAFVESSRLLAGTRAIAAQTRATQLGRLQRLTELSDVVPAQPW
eukprot:9440909-Pyramimonas_sp.AAC.2